MKKIVSLILLSIMLLGAWQFNFLISAEEKPVLTNESVENKFEGKVISILGDSISTFAGYIPVADGFNLEHLPRYPQDNLLTDVNETWWMQVINSLDAKLGINDSWRGATVSGAVPVTTGTTGDNAAMSNLTRIQNLGSNGTPDIILFYGGTNDLSHVSKVGSFDPNTAPSVVDLTTKKWDNLADSYVQTLLRLRYYYPDAVIIAMLPTYTKSYYSASKLAEANSVLAQICNYYGVTYVDLRDCGITTSDLPDGIHPDANGMDYITEAVLDALLSESEINHGESVVYSVTHKLTGAKSSLSYYKGITHGKSFVTTITGENVTVSVTMGGVDITNSVYSGGVVNIPEVTGDIVITARGKIKPIYEDYLQNIPENICHKTNLWNELEHNREYYTASGWGVNSLSTVYSVTFPVKAGDQVFATSFGAAGTNGGTTNGIRLTWFNEEGVIKSLSPAETYAEFSKNGFLTAPENAVAVNVVVWDVNKTNELYILNRDHNYKNGICTGCGATQPGPIITQQPTNDEAKLGENFIVEVKAEGENLKYQWYFRNAGSSKWYKSSVKDNTYDDVMTKARAGREIYCVITDANGNSVTTDTVKLIRVAAEELKITAQPTDSTVAFGEMFCATVEAQGEGVKYQWYFRNAGSEKWYKSSVKDDTYDDVMTQKRAGREIYCVITDALGNKVTTDIVTLIAIPKTPLKLITQAENTYTKMGENFCVTVEAEGDFLTYQWYFRNAGSEKWYKSSVRDNTYDDVMTKARANREIYCVITDATGNKIVTDVATIVLNTSN